MRSADGGDNHRSLALLSMVPASSNLDLVAHRVERVA